MSDPQHPHLLRREQEKGAGGEYVAGRYAQMHCDSAKWLRCPLPPIRAPRLVVFPRTTLGFEPVFIATPIYKFTTLHYCERHKNECSAETILDSRAPWGPWTIRREIEEIAKRKWAHDLKPDFDNARLEWMLTTTPEYRRFLEMLEEGMQSDPWSGARVL